MENWFQLGTSEVLTKLRTSLAGLTNEAVVEIQQSTGKNVLKEGKRKTKFSVFAGQFKDVMIIILFIAACISFITGEQTDAFVVLAIIIGNAIIGFVQENNAEEAIKMLQKMSAQSALVIRNNNNHIKIQAEELVPGDIIVLSAGDIVPADGRLIDISSFKTDEAALTGESHSVEKSTVPITDNNPGPADQLNMVFKGTIVSNGSAHAVVTAIGMNTEIGKIAGMLGTGEQKTPLQKRLAIFSKQLAIVVVIICLIVFGFGLYRGETAFLMFLTALSLAVAALPEALPAVITIALAKGARRMVAQKALMRKLPAVETLGSVTYICTDKTGTLTKNLMTVEKVKAATGKEELLRHIMLLNNEVKFADDGTLLGDSTETALVKYALDNGLSKQQSDQHYPIIASLPFDSERMRMSTFHQFDEKYIMFVKGAPSKIMEVISGKTRSADWLSLNREWAAEGLRVLLFASKNFDQKPEKIAENLEVDLEIIGMVAMIDPPRPEVIEAIANCKTAGIKTIMITGDQPLTAAAIAQRLNMVDGKVETRTGAELHALSEEQFENEVKSIQVFARVSPGQKLDIVKALQKNGQFVAMTGDGVNDAPSLKQADIGIAMGITGSDVSKESADMILLDDNFATIIKAIKEGRRIYENIRKFILYVLSCNLAEILTIFFAPIFGLAVPLLPIHILWINLVTDGLPGLALTSEKAEKDIMHIPPRSPKENLFAQGLLKRIVCNGTVIAIAVISTQFWANRNGYSVPGQQTIVFTLLCFVQLSNALSARSAYRSVFGKQFFGNRFLWITIVLTVLLQIGIIYITNLEFIFKVTALNFTAMAVIVAVTMICFLAFEVIKYATRINKSSGKK